MDVKNLWDPTVIKNTCLRNQPPNKIIENFVSYFIVYTFLSLKYLSEFQTLYFFEQIYISKLNQLCQNNTIKSLKIGLCNNNMHLKVLHM